MTNQLIIPFRGLDANARPQSGARCYVYQSGTTTQVTVTNAAGTALPWPVVADINGAFPQMFYAGALALKAVLRDANDVTLPGGTIDPVAVVSNVSSAAAIAFAPTDEVPETNVQDAIDALGIKATISAGTGVTITTPAGTPVIGLTPGALTQIGALSLVEGDLLYRDASTVSRLPKGTAGQQLVMNAGATAPQWGSGVTLGTAQTTTSGTSVDFTGIPAWARRVTVMLNAVSFTGTSAPLIQLGDSGGIETTGYVGAAVQLNSGSSAVTAPTSSTAGFPLPGIDPAVIYSGTITISNISGNTWIASIQAIGSGGYVVHGSGAKTLSAALDRIRLTTAGGTDAFDAGSVNISWE